jgi:Do/DeqQ family serine protease
MNMATQGHFQTVKNLVITAGLAALLIIAGMFFLSQLSFSPRGSAPVSTDVIIAPSEAQMDDVFTSPSPFVAVAEQVKPTVVNISAERITERSVLPWQSFPFFENPFEEYFRDREEEPQQRRRMREQNLGSGVIIDPQGYILTNNHVVRNAEDIKVRLSDDREFQAEVIGEDPETDVALIKLDIEEPLPPEDVATLGDSDEIQVGDWAIAIGNPFGLDRTVTVGVISAKGRSNLDILGGAPAYQNFIQTDASINFGNSGGPLVNIKGEVVGINTAINVQGQGIGFAIPINMARKISDELRMSGKVVRGYMGMLPQEITRDMAEALDLSSTAGVLVGQVSPDTPAEKGGLMVGDVIVVFDGRDVTGVEQFRLMVAEKNPGSEVDIEIIREGKRKQLSMTLGDRADYLDIASEREPGEDTATWLGMDVDALGGEFARRMGVDEEEGVVVTHVEVGSPAEDAGIAPGDVIQKINLKDVRDLADYGEIRESLEGQKKAISFHIKRDGRASFVAVKPE